MAIIIGLGRHLDDGPFCCPESASVVPSDVIVCPGARASNVQRRPLDIGSSEIADGEMVLGTSTMLGGLRDSVGPSGTGVQREVARVVGRTTR